MNAFLKAMSAAASGMTAQGFRMRVVSENVSNIDTPGYHRKLLSFQNVYDGAAGVDKVEVGRVSLSRAALEQKYDPANPMADKSGYVQMSNVNLMTEMADAREANQTYEANLQTFQQARQMYTSLLSLLKK